MKQSMTMKKAVGLIAAGFMLLLVFAVLIKPDMADAKTARLVDLKPGVTYKAYDITGDGHKDAIKVTSKNINDTLKVKVAMYVNGRKCFERTEYGWLKNVQLLKLKGKNAVIHLHLSGEDDNAEYWRFLKYKGNRLKSVMNLKNVISKKVGVRKGTVKAVRGNTVTVKYNACTYTSGITEFQLKCYYRGSKFTFGKIVNKIKIFNRKSFKYQSKKLTIAKKAKVFNSCKSKKVKFVVKKGQKVNLLQGKIQGGKLCVKIKRTADGKTGWVKAFNKRYLSANGMGILLLFKEGIYAP